MKRQVITTVSAAALLVSMLGGTAAFAAQTTVTDTAFTLDSDDLTTDVKDSEAGFAVNGASLADTGKFVVEYSGDGLTEPTNQLVLVVRDAGWSWETLQPTSMKKTETGFANEYAYAEVLAKFDGESDLSKLAYIGVQTWSGAYSISSIKYDDGIEDAPAANETVIAEGTLNGVSANDFNKSLIAEGGAFRVEYSADTKAKQVLVLQEWNEDGKDRSWCQIEATKQGKTENGYFAEYSYDAIKAAWGEDFENIAQFSFTNWGSALQGDTMTTTPTKLSWLAKASELPEKQELTDLASETDETYTVYYKDVTLNGNYSLINWKVNYTDDDSDKNIEKTNEKPLLMASGGADTSYRFMATIEANGKTINDVKLTVE